MRSSRFVVCVALGACCLAAGTLSSTALGATSLTWVGGDFDTHGDWRTTSVVKPLDGDGDNVYGTDGYLLFNSGSAAGTLQPAYAAVIRSTGTGLWGPGTAPFVAIDNPALTPGPGPIANIYTGELHSGLSGNNEADFIQITMTADHSFRLGILQDNTNIAAQAPISLRLRQTAGGSRDTGQKATTTDRDIDGDWYFFDVTNAKIGDVYVLSAVGDTGNKTNAIGGITFDTIPVPEPATMGLLVLGGVGLIARRKRS